MLTDGEEVTLMDWGNAFVRGIQRDGGRPGADVRGQPVQHAACSKGRLAGAQRQCSGWGEHHSTPAVALAALTGAQGRAR